MQYLGGSLGPAALGATCDLIVQRDTLVLASPTTEWRSCPVAGRTIAGDTMTSLGYARGSRPPIIDERGWGAIVALATIGKATHVIAIAFRDDTGAVRAATFGIVGTNVDDLLRSLSRISRSPVTASAQDARRLPRDLPTTVSVDPLGRIMPNMAQWQARQTLLTGKADPFEWTPDGAVLLAANALWNLPSMQLLTRLPKGSPPLGTFSADGRTLALWFRGAAEITVINVPEGTLHRRVAAPGPIDHLLLGEDGTRAFAVHTAGLSSIFLDGRGIAWTSPLSLDDAPSPIPAWGAHVWHGGIVAFKRWVGVWNGETGMPILEPGAVLQDLPPEERAGRIVDAQVVGSPPRLLLLYGTRQGLMLSEVDLASRARLRTTRLLESAPAEIWNSHWFSSNRARLLVRSGNHLTLWDTQTFTVLGNLADGWGGRGELSVSFDASGTRVATSARDTALTRVHAIIWDVATQRAIGQCLLDATSAARLMPDGRAIVAARDEAIVICAPAADTVAHDR
ncbi:MAG: hypothetical protein AB7H81_12270 [Vicinamibacterales bacterium]